MRIPLDFSRDRMLNMIGLQPRRSMAAVLLPSMGMFGVGLLAGAGLGLLFAPKKGAETRRELGSKLSDAKHRVGEAATTVARKLRRQKDDLTEALEDIHDSANYGGNGVSTGYPATP